MDREQHILAIIRHNPFITQRELAAAVGMSRSAVAGYIASLTRKGSIRGRAYVLAEGESVVCIGGANLDSKATGKQPLRIGSSNPVSVTDTCGGVARNIACNLAALNASVSLLTLVGDDQAGRWVLDDTIRRGVHVGLSQTVPDAKTGSYTAVLDGSGELFLALANMDIYDRFTPRLLRDKWPHIAGARLVIADANPPADTLEELVLRCRDASIPLLVDPVSAEKAKKLPADLTGVTALFPNGEEARMLAGAAGGDTPVTKEEAGRLAEAIRGRGAEHVFITLGECGVYYAGPEDSATWRCIPTPIVDVTGAGDAFVAGVAYGVLRGQPFGEACAFGMAAAHLALQTAESVPGLLGESTLDDITIQFRNRQQGELTNAE